MTRTSLALAFVAALLCSVAACDPCFAAYELHTQRCAEGNADSCAWLDAHPAAITAVCE